MAQSHLWQLYDSLLLPGEDMGFWKGGANGGLSNPFGPRGVLTAQTTHLWWQSCGLSVQLLKWLAALTQLQGVNTAIACLPPPHLLLAQN